MVMAKVSQAPVVRKSGVLQLKTHIFRVYSLMVACVKGRERKVKFYRSQ